jgi:hypothetical protein
LTILFIPSGDCSNLKVVWEGWQLGAVSLRSALINRDSDNLPFPLRLIFRVRWFEITVQFNVVVLLHSIQNMNRNVKGQIYPHGNRVIFSVEDGTFTHLVRVSCLNCQDSLKRELSVRYLLE